MSDDDDDTWTIMIKHQKLSSPASASDDNSEVVVNSPTEVASDDNSEVVVNSPESPNVLMSSEECDIIIEDAMAQKIVNECQKSCLSLETVIHNVCQDVTVTLMTLEWQKDLQRDIQRTEPHLK